MKSGNKSILVLLVVVVASYSSDAFTPASWISRGTRTTTTNSLYGTSADHNCPETLSSTQQQLEYNKKEPHQQAYNQKGVSWSSSVLVVLSGWAFASQVALASLVMPAIDIATVTPPPTSASQTVELTSTSSPGTFLLSANYETLDFTMPSYNDAIKGDDVPTKKAPELFNPFGDFEPIKKTSSSGTSSSAETTPAAPEKEAETTKADLPEIKVPEFKAPEFKAPEFKAPEFKAPEFKAPEMNIPDFKKPEVNFPEVTFPDFKKPEVNLPEFTIPEFKAPDINLPAFKFPKVSLPKVDLPVDISTPKLDGMAMPQVNVPKVELALPAAVTGKVDPSEALEPQEVRDERARNKREEFLAYNDIAKAKEAEAREARSLANEKKREAKEARDEACKDRPGGTVFCFRNPFQTGF